MFNIVLTFHHIPTVMTAIANC